MPPICSILRLRDDEAKEKGFWGSGKCDRDTKRAKSRKEGFRSQVALAKFRLKQGFLFFGQKARCCQKDIRVGSFKLFLGEILQSFYDVVRDQLWRSKILPILELIREDTASQMWKFKTSWTQTAPEVPKVRLLGRSLHVCSFVFLIVVSSIIWVVPGSK